MCCILREPYRLTWKFLKDRHQKELRWQLGNPNSKYRALIVEGKAGLPGTDAPRVAVLTPLTYMNESGQAVALLVRRAGVDRQDPDDPDHRGPDSDTDDTPTLARRLIVVHDELDLPSGRVKIKAGGGNAGNNGLKSIESHLHTNRYLRVRVGIGKPPGRQPGADYVLKQHSRIHAYDYFDADETIVNGITVAPPPEVADDWDLTNTGIAAYKAFVNGPYESLTAVP